MVLKIPLEILSALLGLKHLVLSSCETLFSSVVFVLGGKPENPEKNPLGIRTNNKLNPHMTPGSGIELLSPLRYPCLLHCIAI